MFVVSAGTEVQKLDKPLLKVSDVITRQMSVVHKHLDHSTCVRLYSQVHLLSQTRSVGPEQERSNEFTNRRRSLQIIHTSSVLQVLFQSFESDFIREGCPHHVITHHE